MPGSGSKPPLRDWMGGSVAADCATRGKRSIPFPSVRSYAAALHAVNKGSAELQRCSPRVLPGGQGQHVETELAPNGSVVLIGRRCGTFCPRCLCECGVFAWDAWTSGCMDSQWVDVGVSQAECGSRSPRCDVHRACQVFFIDPALCWAHHCQPPPEPGSMGLGRSAKVNTEQRQGRPATSTRPLWCWRSVQMQPRPLRHEATPWQAPGP